MANTKEIKTRIKSVNNTKKITKAMEMVAATKMRRSVEAVLKTRTYANLSWASILNIASSINSMNLHPLLMKKKETKKVCIVLFSSNRGLCGGFNTTIMNKAIDSIKKSNEAETDFVIIGKKGLSMHTKHGYKIVAEFPKVDIVSEIKEMSPISRLIIDDFLANKYDKILLAYTDFVNVAKQTPRVRQILPVDIDAEDDYLGAVGKGDKTETKKEFIEEKNIKHLKGKNANFLFKYEPSAEEVLNEMIPRLIEVQLFQALLESNASEHSARMSAMHMATDAANDLVNELVLFYNKARQASITAEIAEISAGSVALS